MPPKYKQELEYHTDKYTNLASSKFYKFTQCQGPAPADPGYSKRGRRRRE